MTPTDTLIDFLALLAVLAGGFAVLALLADHVAPAIAKRLQMRAEQHTIADDIRLPQATRIEE